MMPILVSLFSLLQGLWPFVVPNSNIQIITGFVKTVYWIGVLHGATVALVLFLLFLLLRKPTK